MKDLNQHQTVDKKSGRVRVQTMNNEPSLTQQQFKDECDINNIVKKYATTGVITHVNQRQGRYADVSMVTDYREMLDAVRYADEAFMSLDAETRARFRNDPAQLLDFLQDEKNYDEGVKLGLVNPRKVDKTPGEQKPNDLNEQNKTPGEQPQI